MRRGLYPLAGTRGKAPPNWIAAKERVGSFAYRAQYLAAADRPRRGIFSKRAGSASTTMPPLRFDKVVMALDTAFSTKATRRLQRRRRGRAARRGGREPTPPGFYILRAWRGRVTFGDLKQTVVDLARDYNPDEVLVEAKASGQSLLQELQADTVLPVKAVDADIDKRSRANAVSPLFESGRVFLPEDVPWLQAGGQWVRDLRDEFSRSFPAATTI